MGSRSRGTSAPPARRPRSVQAPTPPGAAKSEAARATLSEATVRREPSDRDMRSKRPPALSFLLRMSTLRRGTRVISLLALDFVGVALAIFTALVLKAAVLGHVEASQASGETRRIRSEERRAGKEWRSR